MSASDTSTQVSPHLRPTELKNEETIEPIRNNSATDEKDGQLSKIPSAAPPDFAAEAPDGGLWAWLQVMAAFFLFFNPWGMVNAFGAFQNYYDRNLGQPPSNISWIGTFQGFLLLLVGTLTGPLYDKGLLFELLGFGTFLMAFGMMMTSLSTEYYQVFLAQGICMGVGAGCLFIPSVAVVVQWFSKKRSVAIGIAAAGGSIGAILYPIIFQRLESSIGFGWATRIIGFIVVATLAFSLSFVRRRVKPTGEARALFDKNALRSPAFWAMSLGVFFLFLGQYIPFFYMSSWAEDTLDVDPDFAFYLLSLLNAGSMFGRLIPGLLAVKLGSLNLMLGFLIMTMILAFAWLSVDSLATTILFSIFYGFFSGAGVSLPATIVANITPDIQMAGTWMGMCFGIASLGLLAGNPIAGAIIDAQGGSYVGAQCFGGASMAIGVVCLSILRWLKFKAGKKWNDPV